MGDSLQALSSVSLQNINLSLLLLGQPSCCLSEWLQRPLPQLLSCYPPPSHPLVTFAWRHFLICQAFWGFCLDWSLNIFYSYVNHLFLVLFFTLVLHLLLWVKGTKFPSCKLLSDGQQGSIYEWKTQDYRWHKSFWNVYEYRCTFTFSKKCKNKTHILCSQTLLL